MPLTTRSKSTTAGFRSRLKLRVRARNPRHANAVVISYCGFPKASCEVMAKAARGRISGIAQVAGAKPTTSSP
jgi:hypothetical protein